MRTDDLVDLDWYFGGKAEADLGIRSVQSGFESAMNLMSLCECARPGHAEKVGDEEVWIPGDIPARQTRATNRDAAIDQLIERPDKLADFRRIYARLHKLPQRHHAVLELQFGDAVRVHGVSVSLLCNTTRVREATARVNARRAQRAEKMGRNPPEPIGPRDAVVRMCTSASAAEQTALTELATEAKGVLDAAIDAYSKAKVD